LATAAGGVAVPRLGQVRPVIAYVTNVGASGSGTVTPIRTLTDSPGKPIGVGEDPTVVAITPNGDTAYVLNQDSDTVTPIQTVTGTAGAAISVGSEPAAIAFTPDGSTAYVANAASGTDAPIKTATDKAGAAIALGAGPSGIAEIPLTRHDTVGRSHGRDLSAARHSALCLDQRRFKTTYSFAAHP
jgi:YVTN family beta-propeller protein